MVNVQLKLEPLFALPLSNFLPILISAQKISTEQTAEEMIKCKKFGREVAELLSDEPHHAISFARFIPTYHRFFNRQCKVGEYGVNKLVDLFEALPDVVRVQFIVFLSLSLFCKLSEKMVMRETGGVFILKPCQRMSRRSIHIYISWYCQ